MYAVRSVLIVDEDLEAACALAAAFQHCGYRVRTAFRARETLAGLRDHPFDLLILDLMLSEGSGLCLLSMVRRLYPRLPALVLTADDSLENTLKALRLGARGYLLKPVIPNQVLYCAGEILKEVTSGAPELARWKPGRPGAERPRSRRARRSLDPEELY